VTGIRQALLVLALGLASFGALFAVARADGDSEPEPARKAAPVRPEIPEPASVNVADLGRADPLPAMRVRTPAPEPDPEPVVETPVVDPDEPAEPVEPVAPPIYEPPPSTPAPSPPPPPPEDPGESFDDSG
jgi:hypothetical protein